LSGRLAPTVVGDLYVAKDGDDANDGTSRETALASIQAAVDLLQPGQTLVIGPGEYFGPVLVDHLGSMEVDTVIRAEIPGTVILRGDIPAPSFEPVAGTRWVYGADFDSDYDVQMVNEHDTLKLLKSKPNIIELEYAPKHFFQDSEAKKLYIASSDTLPADQHFYTLSVVDTHGLYLDTPLRVRIEGLTVTGFNSRVGQSYGQQTLYATYGIFIKNGKQSVISNCQAYMNGRGIGSSNEYDSTSGGNLITGCKAWGNGGPGLGYDTGGIDLLYSRNDQIVDSEAFLNSANGISFRGGVLDHSQENASFVRNSLSWGNLEYEFWIKAGENFNYYENSVTPGSIGNTNHLRNCVVGSGSSQGDDSIILNQETDLDLEAEFADPKNHDYRLQAGSRFVGAASDGSDRGAFSYQENIFYLAPGGSDTADGLSVAQAWGSLAQALGGLSPGDTLYLSPGSYPEDFVVTLNGTPENPIIIRGRGLDPAIIAGRLRVQDSSHLLFERIHFAQDVIVINSDAIRFVNDVFLGAGTSLTAANAVALEVTQSSFTGFAGAAISLPCSQAAHLAGNLYDNQHGPALMVFSPQGIRYSDYNSYSNLEGAWQLDPGAGSLEEVKAGHDQAAKEIAATFVTADDSVSLSNSTDFYGGGTAGNSFGTFRREVHQEELRLFEGPRVHSVSATTANIEWITSHPTVTSLSWGPTEAVENQTTLDGNRFSSFSLTGLLPGTTYYLRLDSLRVPDDVEIRAEPVTLSSEIIEFTTKATDEDPQTYYVAPGGSDDNTGLAPEAPFRTIQKAADQVNVGDTVLISGGTYYELVRIKATGSQTAPITFKGQPNELVMFDGAEGQIDFAFVIGKKSHLRFDNFFFSYHGSSVSHTGAWEPHMGGQFNIYQSQDIQISRVFSDGRTTGDRLIVAKNVDGLRLSNTVDGNKLEGHYFENCPNLVIENSVFARPMIAGFILRNAADEPALIHHNIFTDSLAVKSYQDNSGNPNNVYLLVVDARMDGVVFEDNLFFLRYFSPDERHLVNDSGHAELDGVYLFRTIFADPLFQGVLDLLAAGGTLSTYADDQPPFPPDSLYSMERPFNFRTWLATEPTVVDLGIGLDHAQFNTETGLPN
jgi:hypothetical protein